MLKLLRMLWPFSSSSSAAISPELKGLVAAMHYEIVPMKSIDQAMADLPAGADVSVTCSPAKGISVTQEYTEQLMADGFHAVPHFAARMVESEEHVEQLATWLREKEIREIFVIAGDAPEPLGPYEGVVAFLTDLLKHETGLTKVGIAAYPDGHALISDEIITDALHTKQAMLAKAGIEGVASTQMCFDEDKIRTWLEGERANGFTLPIRLGIPGVVDRARLMRMGTRLGIGTSMRYLSKNKSTVMKLMAPGGFDPTDMVGELAGDAERLGIEGLHSFTFNAVAETLQWQQAILDQE